MVNTFLTNQVSPWRHAQNKANWICKWHALPAPGLDMLNAAGRQKYACILADPAWQFINRTGKVAPEHRRLSRYGTMDLATICGLPVDEIAAPTAHLYLWVPNALLPDGLRVMSEWGFQYKSNVIWRKIRKDGGSDGRGVGFYFRNVTEIILFGVRGKNARTLQPGRTQVNYLETRKREHSRKPDEIYPNHRSMQPRAAYRIVRARAFVRGGPYGAMKRQTLTSRPGKRYAHNSATEKRLIAAE